MTKYLVERHLPGITPEQLTAAAGSGQEHDGDDGAGGHAGALPALDFIPGDETCFCLFEGPSVDVVRTANDRARLYERIVEAQHPASDDLY